MKILVLNPPTRYTKNVVRDVLYGCWCKGKRIGGGTVPPLFLLSVATVLKRAGQKVTFIDAQAEQKSLMQIEELINEFDIIIISTSTMTINEDAALLTVLKEKNPNIKTIIFGSHPTFMPSYSLKKSGIDIVVRREPEFIIRDLIKAMDNGQEWKGISGIGYLENGKVVLNDFAPFIENLDQLPFLDTSLLPKNIHYFNPIVKHLPYITTATSRGCPSRCTYCTANAFYGPKFRFRSVKNVVEEMAYYIDRGFREIYFRDETFTIGKKRVISICQGILDRKLDVSWLCNAKVGTVDKETLSWMKKAGCHTIKIGVESGVQEILNRVYKDIKIEDTQKLFKEAREIGINTHAHVMLGLPGETKETIKQTINFVIKLKPTTATFGICTPYPGTTLFKEVTKMFPEIEDGSTSDLSKLHTEGFFNEAFTNLTKEELAVSVKKAYRCFYLRPPYIFSWLFKIRSSDDIKRILLSGARVIDFAITGEKGGNHA